MLPANVLAAPGPEAAERLAEPLPPPGRWTSPVEQRWHRWVLWGTAPVAGLVIIAAVWSTIASYTPRPAELPKPHQAPQAAQTPAQSHPSPTQSQSARDADRLDPRWLPAATTLVVSFRPAVFAQWADAPQILAQFGPRWEQSAGRLVEGLGLKLHGIRRITWASTDLGQWPARSVALLLLEQGHTTAPLAELGEPAGFRIAGRDCRKLKGSAWDFPLAILDERTLLSGPEDLLRDLGARAERKAGDLETVPLRSEAVARLVVSLPGDADLVCMVDLKAAQSAGCDWPAALLDVWPNLAAPWQTVWEVSDGLGLAARCVGPMRLEAAVVCGSETTADKVLAAMGELASEGAQALAWAAESAAPRLEARGLEPSVIGPYERLLHAAQHALRSAEWETADRVVWLRLDFTSSAAEVAGCALRGQTAIGQDRLLAARRADQARQQRLLGALADYQKAEGRLPPGAMGGSVLAPETRLSWIAAILPYLGHEKWYDELQFGYPWNGPQNRLVTRRRLDEVINPAITLRQTEAGFPVTHYVGVAGVGVDAGRVPADDPRGGVFGFARSAALGEIPDGASNTIAILGVSGRLGPWAAGGEATVRGLTQPPYVNGPDGFGTGQPDGMLVGMADGSVRFVSKDVDPRVLEMLATRAGGEEVPLEVLAWQQGTEGQTLPDSTGQTLPDSAAQAPQRPPAPYEPAHGLPSADKQPHAGGPPLVPRDGPLPLIPLVPTPGVEQPGVPRSSVPPKGPAAPTAEPGSAQPPAQPAEEAAADRPLQQPPAPPASAPVDVAARLADQIPAVDFEDVPLGQAVGVLAQLGTVPVSFDPEALLAKEVTLAEPVSIHLEGATLGEAFRAICAQHGLACVVEGGQMLITTPADYRQVLRRMRFTVSDLASDEQAMLALAEMVQMLVAPESWRVQGGRGSLQVDGGALVADQTMEVLGQILAFCERLRTARGLPLRSRYDPERFSLATHSARGANALERTVTANYYHPAPLAEILGYLGQRAQVDILLDRLALAAAGLSDQRPARLSVDNRPLSVALDELLQPFGLAYRVVDELTLQVSTQQAIDSHLELEFHPAAELLAGALKPAELIDRLKARTGGESWSDAGGAGRIVYDKASGCLIVLQSQPVQAAIERLLAEMAAEAQAAAR